MRRAVGLVCGLVAVLAAGALLTPAVARAEPYLMVRAGAKCNDCHTNMTGGGKRTAFAHIHAHDILHDLDLLPIPKGTRPFNGELNSYVSIGSDLRVRNTTVFQDRPNSSGRVPENEAFRRHVESNDIAVDEFRFYGQADLWPDVALLYVDEDFNGGATNREVFGLVRGFLPYDTYAKAGRFFPPFGLRVQDDDAYVRRNTGYTFDSSEEGGEVGFAPGPFFLATSVTNGEAGDRDVAANVNGYGLFTDLPVVRNVLTGASFARQSNKRDVSAFYAGTNLWLFTGLVEFDLYDDRTTASQGKRDSYAAYSELHLLVFDWLDLRGTFEFLKVSNDQDQTRYTIGAESFISRFIQPRIQYRINNGPPTQPTLNRDELWLELHFFL
jgi:hypothetical protein